MNKSLLVLALAGATSALAAQSVVAAEPVAQSTNAIVKHVNEGLTVNAASFINVQYGRERRGPEAVLFSNPDFRGDRYVIEGDYVPDLANTGFNDRAQSVRVNRGYWIFCSDAHFRGRCRTFGPGDYARLGWALDNKVSSGRRINERYPYSGPPNWGDRDHRDRY